MSNSIQEPWKLSESECIIDDWLQLCETDPLTTNLFEVSSPFPRPQKRNQHYKAALDEVRRLRPRSRSLPRNFMDDGNQRVRSRRGGENGVTTRSQGRKNGFNGSMDKKTTSPTKLPTKRPGQSSKTYQYAQNNTASDDPDLIDNVNIDQLQLEECLSTTTSELDFRTPTTLSRSTTFTAATKLTSASRNYRLRSRSPTKRIGDLRAAKPPIGVEAAIKVPQDVKVLRNRFIDIQDGIGVLPRCLQNQLNALDDREYRDIFFDRSAHPNDFNNSDSEATTHARELLKELLSIQDAALRC
ncbi:hypothetical protein V2W45_1330114 [Cenococcum geophilum]